MWLGLGLFLFMLSALLLVWVFIGLPNWAVRAPLGEWDKDGDGIVDKARSPASGRAAGRREGGECRAGDTDLTRGGLPTSPSIGTHAPFVGGVEVHEH